MPSTTKHLINANYDKQVPFKGLHIKTVYPNDLFDDYHDYVDMMMMTVATRMMIML
jgi:hypothetical protein